MARVRIREAHGGATREIDDRALPYFQGWVMLDTLDDSTDASPLYLSKAESDFRYALKGQGGGSDTGVEVAEKRGQGWWDATFAPPVADDTPTVTVSTTSAISGGTTVAPSTATDAYSADPAFRYDGCAAVSSPGTGLLAPVQPTVTGGVYTIIPEFVTSQGCGSVDIKFTMNSAGTTIGLRVTVNGRWLTLPLAWFTTTANTVYYVRLTFPTAKARSLRIETVNTASFGGVVVPAGETVTRPAREIRKRMVILADSYGAGANGNTTNDPATNGCSRFETFPNYVAKLLGCDSVINLGSGGTGWVVDAGKSTFGQRIPDVLAANPHIVLAAGSRNDTTATGSQVYAAATAALAQLADVPVVEVCGISDDGSNSGTPPTTLNEAVRQAARTAGRRFNDVLGVVTPALKNTADNVHPSVVGAQKLGAAFYALLDRPPLDEAVAAAVGGRASVDLALAVSPGGAATTGATVTLTATQSTARAGKVSFYANGALIGTSTPASGVATLTTSSLAAGGYILTARFQPTNPLLVKPSTSNAVAYTISANLGFTDSFTRADGPVGSTENGKPYSTTGGGTYSVASNKLVNTGATSTSYCVADAGTPNGTYQVTIGGTTVNAGYLALRYLNSTNTLRISVQSSQIVLQKVVANVTTALVTGSGGAWAAGDVLKVVINGTTLTVYKNNVAVTGLVGVTCADSGTSAAGIDTATQHGIGLQSAGTAITFDDLSFVAG